MPPRFLNALIPKPRRKRGLNKKEVEVQQNSVGHKNVIFLGLTLPKSWQRFLGRVANDRVENYCGVTRLLLRVSGLTGTVPLGGELASIQSSPALLIRHDNPRLIPRRRQNRP